MAGSAGVTSSELTAMFWWSDIVKISTLQFTDRQQELRFRRLFFNQRGLVSGLSALVELLLSLVIVWKAVYRAQLADVGVKFIYAYSSIVFMLVTRALPACLILIAKPAARPQCMLIYRLSKVPIAFLGALMDNICVHTTDCSHARAQMLDNLLLTAILCPLLVQLPFAWHLPVHLAQTAVSVMFIASQGGVCGVFERFTAAAAPAVGSATHVNLPLVPAATSVLIQRTPLLAQVHSTGCAGNQAVSDGSLPGDERCHDLMQWFKFVLKCCRAALNLLVPQQELLAIPLTNSTLHPQPAQVPNDPLRTGTIEKAWHTMLASPCSPVSVLALVLGWLLVNCMLYQWELRLRLQFWQHERDSAKVEPSFGVIRLFLCLQQAVLFMLCFVVTWCLIIVAHS